MISSIYGCNQKNKDFLALRFAEDAGYCSSVRKEVAEIYAAEMGFNWFQVDGQRGEISNIVRKFLIEFIDENINYDGYKVQILDTYMPWRRMFEVALEVRLWENI
jgi:hypothetical protein